MRATGSTTSARRLSPTLLERYLAAAQKIRRLAVGDPATLVASDFYRIPVEAVRKKIDSTTCRSEHVAG